MFYRLGTGEALSRAFQSAGFGAIACRRLETLLQYADGTSACEAAFVGGPVALAYSRFTEQVKAEAHQESLSSLAAFRQGEGYAVPGEFVIVAGTK